MSADDWITVIAALYAAIVGGIIILALFYAMFFGKDE